jgi:glycosyltransferase involved in cell wall biosynthesis
MFKVIDDVYSRIKPENRNLIEPMQPVQTATIPRKKVQDISVIICAFSAKRWDTLVATIESVCNQTRPAKEVILVIDYNQQLLQRVRAHTEHMERVLVIENSYARGLSGARNSGVETSTADVVAFLDDDAVAEPDWLEHLLTGYEKSPDVISVGGTIFPEWASGRPVWFPEEFNWVYGCTYRGMPNETWPVQRLIGCNMSFRRDIFATIGEFHHELGWRNDSRDTNDHPHGKGEDFRNGSGRIGNLPVAGEETELFARTHHLYPQRVIIFEPRAKVHHHIPASRACWRYFRSRCFAEGITKSLLSSISGSQIALAVEWGYTSLVLPRGVLHGLAEAFSGRDRAGLARAGAIIAGFLFTGLGYLFGKITRLLGIRLIKTSS